MKILHYGNVIFRNGIKQIEIQIFTSEKISHEKLHANNKVSYLNKIQ